MIGDVVGSRREAAISTAYVRALADELDGTYPDGLRLAPTSFTQGDELQALLHPDADPFLAVLRAALRRDRRPVRWAIVAGLVDPGEGPATQRTGTAFLRARTLITELKAARAALVTETGDPDADDLLADVSPLLPRLLDDLTGRQRELARLMLIDGLRRAEVADSLGISRATVSVMAERARIRELGGLVAALRGLFRRGVDRAVAQGASRAPE